MSKTVQKHAHLDRAVGLYPAIAIVIGSVVGSGIFVSSASMARTLQNAPLLLLVWILAGGVSLLGALTQAELASQFPRSGGLYEYFREIYGEKVGFLFGWSYFMISGTGAIPSIALVFAFYLSTFVPLPRFSTVFDQWTIHIPLLGGIQPLSDFGIKSVAAAVIILLTYINIRGIRIGARLQSLTTSTKVLAMLLVALLTFVLKPQYATSPVGFSNYLSSTLNWSNHSFVSILALIITALSGAFWAYSGWATIATVADEVKEPEKTVPRAIILGCLSCIILYVILNLAYLYVLPIDALGNVPNNRVASATMSATLGGFGATLLAVLIMVSTFDCTNSTILTNARVYYAMAKKGRFWKSAAEVHPKFHTPARALIFQMVWSLILLFSGSFDTITGTFVFVNWLFYALIGLGVFLMRVREPNRARPFKVPAYPIIPAVFTLFAISYALLTLAKDISTLGTNSPQVQSIIGVFLVLIGLPFYKVFKK